MQTCAECQRHADHRPELFQLLEPEQRGHMQIVLCGDCPGDPWAEIEG